MRNKSFLETYTNSMALWVVMAGVAAYFRPGIFIPMKPYMTTFFALTMFGIGAVLCIEDFRKVAEKPLSVLIGVLAQFTIMPIGAFIIVKVFALPPEIAVGLILAGSAPGAMASNVMCYIAKADVAYSVSLTSVSTLLTPVVTPALVYILANSILEVDFFQMLLSLMKMVILPLGAGFVMRHVLKERIVRIIKVFPAISTTFIVFICALVIALNRERLGSLSPMIILAAVLLNVNGMFMGYTIGKVSGMDIPGRRTLSIEIGMQNAGLGTVLALTFFGPEAAVPTTAFVFICIFSAALAAAFWRTIERKQYERI